MNWRKPTHPTIPPPRRDVARYVSNIPADDPNGDVARNVSTDKGMYRKKRVLPHVLPSMTRLSK